VPPLPPPMAREEGEDRTSSSPHSAPIPIENDRGTQTNGSQFRKLCSGVSHHQEGHSLRWEVLSCQFAGTLYVLAPLGGYVTQGSCIDVPGSAREPAVQRGRRGWQRMLSVSIGFGELQVYVEVACGLLR
jgi:hypothetical protein